MQVQLLNILSFILYFFTLTASAKDEARFITSNGVIYSYAVKTKTLQPAQVVVSTRYYTTVHVRQITLDNNEVTSTTEQITTQSTFMASIAAVTTGEVTAPLANENAVQEAPVTTNVVEPTLSLLQDQIEATPTTTANTRSTVILTPSQNSSPVATATIASTIPENTVASTRVPTTVAPTTTQAPTTTAPPTSATTATSDDGTCYVYYEDDEYYSTYYITAASQTIDAASTITSTRTKIVYKTITN